MSPLAVLITPPATKEPDKTPLLPVGAFLLAGAPGGELVKVIVIGLSTLRGAPSKTVKIMFAIGPSRINGVVALRSGIH